MTSRSETAIAHFCELLADASAPKGLPRPRRNETLPALLEGIGETDGGFINVLDGATETTNEMLGADIDRATRGYELTQRLEVELIALATDKDARDALLDDLLVLIDDVLAEHRSADDVWSYAGIGRIERTNLATDGLPHVKAATVEVVLRFTSERPF